MRKLITEKSSLSFGKWSLIHVKGFEVWQVIILFDLFQHIRIFWLPIYSMEETLKANKSEHFMFTETLVNVKNLGVYNCEANAHLPQLSLLRQVITSGSSTCD